MSTVKPPTKVVTDNLVSIDYLRLATWDFKTYVKLSGEVRKKFIGWRRSKWLQYKMERSHENVSYGIGDQRNQRHGIFEASGVDAHIFFHWLVTTQQKYIDNLYCARIDLQSTKRQHVPLDYVKVHRTQRKPKKLILGDDGNTLYIGNRESNSYWRIYDKSEGQVRCEVELKSKQAQKIWKAILNDKSIAGLYAGLLKASRLPAFIVADYSGGHDVVDLDALKVEVVEDMEAKFFWLSSLDGFVYKLANDHDFADRMPVLINRWSDYCNEV